MKYQTCFEHCSHILPMCIYYIQFIQPYFFEYTSHACFSEGMMMVLPNSLKHSAPMPWRQVLCNDEVKAALDALTQDPWISMPAYAGSVFSLQFFIVNQAIHCLGEFSWRVGIMFFFTAVHWSLVGGLEHVLYFHILGMSSSQLTFIFFRGVGQPPTRSSLI